MRKKKKMRTLLPICLMMGCCCGGCYLLSFQLGIKFKKKSLYGVVQPCDTVVLIESIPSAVCVFTLREFESLIKEYKYVHLIVFPFFFFFSSSGDDGGKELLGCSAPVGGLCYPLLFLPPRPSGRTVRTLTNHHPLYSLPACLPACRLYRGKVISPGAPCLLLLHLRRASISYPISPISRQ